MSAVDALLGAIQTFVSDEGANPRFRNVISELKTVTTELGTVAPAPRAPSPGQRELNRVTGAKDESPAEERRETPGAEAAEEGSEPKSFANASAMARERMEAARA